MIRIKRGDAKKYDLQLVDYDGNLFNLTGYTVYFMAKEKMSDADEDAVIDKSSTGGGITVVNATNGEITINFVATDTDLPEKTYYYDIRVVSETDGPYSTDVDKLVIEPTVRKGFV